MMEKTLVLLVLLTALELRAAAQSTATCQALQNVADSASGVTCTRNSQCSELLCGVTETTLLQYIRSATLTLLPCSQPAAVRLALYNPSDTVFLNRTVNRTTTILAVDGVLSLVVRLDHLINAIGLGMNGEVTITIPGLGPRSTTVTIFQYTEIPLDTSACLPATTAPTVIITTATSESATTSTTTGVTTGTSSQATSATSPPTSPSATTATGSQVTTTTATTSSPTLAQTCQALDTLVDSAQSLSCSRNVHCDTVQCSVVDPTVRAFISTAILMLLPCNQPPAVRLSGTNPSGSMVLDRVITQSQTIPLQPGTTLGVTLDQLPNAIGFQADASAVVMGFTSSITLVPYVRIPVDSSACSNSTTSTPTLSTTVEPKRNMCAVLEQIASRAPDDFVCSTNQRCDGVDCTADLLRNGNLYRSQAIVLVCQLPHPAVHVVLMTPDGLAIVNVTVDHSEVISLQQVLQVNITLDQLLNAIGLQVEATLLNNPPIPVIEYTVIPVDTTNCQRPTPRTTAATTAATTSGTVRRTDKPLTDAKPGQAASAGNTLVPGAILLLLSLLGSRYCTV